jgi:hypothetical protein
MLIADPCRLSFKGLPYQLTRSTPFASRFSMEMENQYYGMAVVELVASY